MKLSFAEGCHYSIQAAGLIVIADYSLAGANQNFVVDMDIDSHIVPVSFVAVQVLSPKSD
jgi:hypothetical protein